MEILDQQGWKAEAEPKGHFRQELIPHGHMWPSGVVLPTNVVDLYNLYTTNMNAHVENPAMWGALFKDRSLFLTACLNEAEAARARANPMALLRRAVAAQAELWIVLGELEELFDIENDDKACGQLADEIKEFVANGSVAGLTVTDLMQFIDAMGHRRMTATGATVAAIADTTGEQA